MTFSAYDSDAVRLLSATLSDAMEIVRMSFSTPLSETETSIFRKRIAANLMKTHDAGERDPRALKIAGLRNAFASEPKT